MFVLRHPQPGKRPPSGVVHFGSVQSVWEPVSYQGQSLLGAHVPDGHPEAQGIRKTMSTFKATSVVEDADVTVANLRPAAGPGAAPDQVIAESRHWSEDPVVQEIARRAIGIVRATDLARARGWRDDEIAFTGIMGDPTGGGGRNPITGLALAELMLTVPPPDWPELRDHKRPPWESSRFIPPHFAWTPPSWREADDVFPDPYTGALRTTGAPITTEPESVTADDEDSEEGDLPSALPSSGSAGLRDAQVATLDDAQNTPLPAETLKGAQNTPLPAETLKGAQSTPYPAEHLEAVREIVRDMMSRNSGKMPAVNAVNFLLAKKEIPKLSKTQLESLFTT